MSAGLSTLKNRVELLVMGWIRLFIENKVDNIPIEIKLVCKNFFGTLIDSKILKTNEENSLLMYIEQQTKQNWNWSLIYRATEHGFKRQNFYDHCEDKSNTVVIIHNEYDQVFGGYTPCPWIDNKESRDKYGEDKALTTFVFILRSNYSKVPQISKLKKNKFNKAVCYLDNTAFDFGCNDFYLFREEICADTDCCFEWNDDAEYCLSGPEIYTKPTEIEIYQLY